MASLKQKRGHIKSQITKTLTKLLNNKEEGSLTLTYFTDVKDMILEKLKDIDEYNQDILEDLSSDTELSNEMDDEIEYKLSVMSTLAELKDFITPAGGNRENSSSDVGRIRNQLKLPQIPLPSYNHREGESLERFLTEFETIMSKFSLSAYERFIFLKKTTGW